MKSPQWQGKTWDQSKNEAVIPAEESERSFFFAREEQKQAEIQTLLDQVAQIDAAIDEKVLVLYDITNPSDQQRILGSALTFEEEDSLLEEINEQDETDSDHL